MNFLGSILPSTISRWQLSNATMSSESLTIRPGGYALIQLNNDDIRYIPNAFQFVAIHNKLIDWKDPTCYAELAIRYEDGELLRSFIPMNPYTTGEAQFQTRNVSILRSALYTTLSFGIYNPETEPDDLVLTLYELRPSVDLDDGLRSQIEALLPQLVYTNNAFDLTLTPGVENLILSLPITTDRDTNLITLCTVTGVCNGGNLSCIIKYDGSDLAAFPVQQQSNTGNFFFGVPTLIPFVTAGQHLITVYIQPDSASSIIVNKAMITLEGKGVLGGSSGAFPSAEAFQDIPWNDFRNFAGRTITSEVGELTFPAILDGGSYSVTIPTLPFRIFTQEYSIEFIHYGVFIDLSNRVAGGTPDLVPPVDFPFVADFEGFHPATNEQTFEPVFTDNDTYITSVTKLDTSDFDPIISLSEEEVSFNGS